MKKWQGILFISAWFTSSLSFSMTNDILQFAGAEHVAAGNQVKLYFTPDDPGQLSAPLHLPNGLNLTYGEILSLGDFYGTPGHPISSEPSEKERRDRFITAFNAFATSASAVTETPKILNAIQSEQKALDDGMKQGEKPEQIYAKIEGDQNRQYNCITGGSCVPSAWWMIPGRYLQLAQKDFDHFGPHAWLAYQTGHQLALETAVLAHQTHDLQKLQLAYAMNAFACHFLSDRFASGHIRTPRAELPASVTPSVIGSLLATFMHAEENQYGLHAYNQQGDHWIVYGDHYYFDSISDTNRAMLQESLQTSADEIFSAYQQGIAPSTDAVANLIPFKDENQPDIAPLFDWNAQTHTLYRRTNISNVYDRHQTSNWWGWTTLILLASERGLPTLSQAQLVSAGFGKEAMAYGLITDKDVLNYAKKMTKNSGEQS